jgi:hypothetical protein
MHCVTSQSRPAPQVVRDLRAHGRRVVEADDPYDFQPARSAGAVLSPQTLMIMVALYAGRHSGSKPHGTCTNRSVIKNDSCPERFSRWNGRGKP